MTAATPAPPSTAPPSRIPVPAPGRAVLACRCGTVLGLVDMHRPVRPWPRSSGSHALVEPVCCERCATNPAR